jgi:hypothetical protein
MNQRASNPHDIEGRRFRKLIAQWTVGQQGHHIKWLCVCDCGGLTIVFRGSLLSGATRSCRCLGRKHGHTAGDKLTPTYAAWQSMMFRCVWQKGPNRYNQAGVAVCARWQGVHGFANFLVDMGEKPANPTGINGRYWSLDRFPNPVGDYEPGNVR